MKAIVSWALSLSILITGCGTVTANGSAGTPGTATTNQPVVQNNPAPSAPESPLVGHKAPNFDLKTLSEQTSVPLQSLLGKQPILINVWASWCPPCQQETPDLVAMSKKYAGKVQFVGVDMTSDNDSVSAATAFVHQYGVSYLTLLDLKGTFSKDYQIMGYPTTYIVEPNGTVQNMHIGLLTRDQMEALITDALAARTTPQTKS